MTDNGTSRRPVRSTCKTRPNTLPHLVCVTGKLPYIRILYYIHFKRRVFITFRLAQPLEGLTTNLKIVGSSPTVGKKINMYFPLFTRSLNSSTETIQMKSNVTFIRGNRRKRKKYGGGTST